MGEKMVAGPSLLTWKLIEFVGFTRLDRPSGQTLPTTKYTTRLGLVLA